MSKHSWDERAGHRLLICRLVLSFEHLSYNLGSAIVKARPTDSLFYLSVLVMKQLCDSETDWD